MSMNQTYFILDDLVDRLKNITIRREKTVTFLVGCPLTAPDHVGGHGVPDVSGMIDLVRTELDDNDAVAVSKHGGSFYRTVLHADGNLAQTVGEGNHIIHLHGYWYGYDSLHTPRQLRQERPQLKKSLERVIENSVLVVVGYGGWDDVITHALANILSDSTSSPEILWTFHDADTNVADTSRDNVLRILEPGLDRGRVSLYAGIDCYSLLSATLEQVRPLYLPESRPGRDSSMTTVVTKEVLDRERRTVRIEVAFPIPSGASSESDSPLIVSPWIGRDQELSILTSSSAPIVFLTGIGGQGKSALAGRFLKSRAMSSDGRFDFWDWRDCREERDRLATQLLHLIERLTDGSVDASQIEVSDIRAIVGVLFHVLKDRKALLVFDNVDQYVDLDTGEPIRGLDILISEAVVCTHQSCFLFTCRPGVTVDESRAIRIRLSGLTESETKDLIAARGLAKELALARELYQATDGHPLWISLIAMQAVKLEDGLRGALDLIKQGEASLPETTIRTIWRTLNKQQRDVLRTMAELDRPEPWNHLLSMLPGVNANRVDRALRFLKNVYLIELRTQVGGDPLVGLHPIIREFVRAGYPKKVREQYVGKILDYLDRMIGRFRNILSEDPSYDVLEHWIRKAEYQITFAHYDRATDTIAEISQPLTNRGYAEDMIRLTLRLLSECDWTDACTSYRQFDRVFGECLINMIQMGHEAVLELLKKYEHAVSQRSTQFILLCNLRCYFHWYLKEYDEAIRWGEEGERLHEEAKVDTAFSTRHNLALARRDGGNMAQALESFLQGEILEKVTEEGTLIEGRHASFYGNIGRCLFLNERRGEALPCYMKSAQLLEKERGHDARLNRGYIRLWIGELLFELEEFELAAASYRSAVCVWEEVSPPRATEAACKLEELVNDHKNLKSYRNARQWTAEAMFARWIEGH